MEIRAKRIHQVHLLIVFSRCSNSLEANDRKRFKENDEISTCPWEIFYCFLLTGLQTSKVYFESCIFILHFSSKFFKFLQSNFFNFLEISSTFVAIFSNFLQISIFILSALKSLTLLLFWLQSACFSLELGWPSQLRNLPQKAFWFFYKFQMSWGRHSQCSWCRPG